MKSMDLLETIGSIRDKYVLEAHSQFAAPKKRIPSKRLLLVAAIITLMLLLVGCAVVLLGLWDLRLGEYPIDAGFGETQTGEFISLSGFVGSKEYLANKEWIDFEKQYDPRQSRQGSDPQELPPRSPYQSREGRFEGSRDRRGFG